jgi:hypothetical protein
MQIIKQLVRQSKPVKALAVKRPVKREATLADVWPQVK